MSATSRTERHRYSGMEPDYMSSRHRVTKIGLRGGRLVRPRRPENYG